MCVRMFTAVSTTILCPRLRNSSPSMWPASLRAAAHPRDDQVNQPTRAAARTHVGQKRRPPGRTLGSDQSGPKPAESPFPAPASIPKRHRNRSKRFYRRLRYWACHSVAIDRPRPASVGEESDTAARSKPRRRCMPAQYQSRSRQKRFPRTRGDRPCPMLQFKISTLVPPHTRG